MQAVAERISAGRQPVAVPERSYENGEDSPILAGGNDVVPKGRARKQGALKEAEQDMILKRGSRGKFQKVLDLPGFPDTAGPLPVPASSLHRTLKGRPFRSDQ